MNQIIIVCISHRAVKWIERVESYIQSYCFYHKMPFISKDWRSPGEEWVKTQEGWEKKKVLECSAQR